MDADFHVGDNKYNLVGGGGRLMLVGVLCECGL